MSLWNKLNDLLMEFHRQFGETPKAITISKQLERGLHWSMQTRPYGLYPAPGDQIVFNHATGTLKFIIAEERPVTEKQRPNDRSVCNSWLSGASSEREFDWDAFNTELQKSSNICSGARKDIERAVAAGKGDAPAPSFGHSNEGEVWEVDTGFDKHKTVFVQAGFGKFAFIVLGTGNRVFDAKPADEIKVKSARRLAKNLQEYFTNGGKL